ncbi:MAG: FAD-dependent oxidoreductase [Bacilli bacterium]|jgi:thioredoxin reductase (NADPH)|nr:FAD-dependent oxidoreductase [Bacilli bacterium]
MIDNQEVAVIGLGPSGVTASIYLKRFGMTPVPFEREQVGGQVDKTEQIENYPGFPIIKGPELGQEFEKHLAKFSIEPIYTEVSKITLMEDGNFHVEYGLGKSRDFHYVILASGLSPTDFHIPGEDAYQGRGFSRCAICDGPFYKGKEVAVIGAGNSAFEEASYLASLCSHVTLIARRTQFRAAKASVDRFTAFPNTTLLAPYDIVGSAGTKKVESLTLKNKENGEEKTVPVSGVFLYVGEKAETSLLRIPGLTDEKGYLVTDENMETKAKNLYATGDIRVKNLRQVATAVNDGAIAATAIHQDYQESK